ncbi:MAG: tRNA (adenosine(37)-N6)-dimethylallyltransferase MiaA [Pseudomonadota bacterium]
MPTTTNNLVAEDHNLNKKPVVFIMGPTASGKTGLAIELVQKYPFEIISVDSALIYKDMDIGTAKPTAEELKIAPHHLIDFLDPSLSYSVADFRADALAKIENIHKRDKIPLLVGGTMLYHRALLYGLSQLPPSNAQIRESLNQLLADKGGDYLHQQLSLVDPVAAKRIHPNDPQRIQRALEVYQITGIAMSVLQQQSQQQALGYPFYKMVIAPKNRERLRERIAIRFEQMIKEGFIEEVKKLHQRGDLSLDLPSMRCVGYRQVWEYLENELSYTEMLEKGINVTRQFAKRQMTWLRKEQDVLWLESEHHSNLQRVFSYIAEIVE